MIAFLLIILCFRRKWFYVEPGQNNPYKMVRSVLHYVKQHKYPIRRSAFTYSGDEHPSRMDFAKERYGGPFTTEQVEDVKTFFRILFVLLALGPVFALDLPTSLFMSIKFGGHTGFHPFTSEHLCKRRLNVLQRGSIDTSVATVLLFPLYMWVVFSVLKRTPKMFIRLFFSITLYILGVFGMLCTDLAGHLHLKSGENIHRNTSMCMFSSGDNEEQPVLKLHQAVLLIPGLLLGLGSPIVMATTFEFISAQSPSSMKGLLVGVFFTVRAFFQIISGVAVTPFAYKPLWNRRSIVDHPRIAFCAFEYFLVTSGAHNSLKTDERKGKERESPTRLIKNSEAAGVTKNTFRAERMADRLFREIVKMDVAVRRLGAHSHNRLKDVNRRSAPRFLQRYRHKSSISRDS